MNLVDFRNIVKDKFPDAKVFISFSMEERNTVLQNWCLGLVNVDTGHEGIMFELRFTDMSQIDWCLNNIASDIKEFVL